MTVWQKNDSLILLKGLRAAWDVYRHFLAVRIHLQVLIDFFINLALQNI